MDGPAFGEHAAANVDNLETGSFEHFLRGFLHVFGHAVLVVAEFIMKTQSRDAPLVFDDRIEVDIILVASENFAECAHTDEGTLVLADFFLEGSAEAMRICAARKHRAAAATFKSITADTFGMLFVQVASSGA